MDSPMYSWPIYDGKITGWDKITKIDQVRKGDYMRQWKALSCFDGIVLDVHFENRTLTIARYTWPKRIIKPVTVKVGEARLEKAVYTGSCYPADEVIKRAQLRLFEQKHHPIYNRAKSFPRWCKTGNGGGATLNIPLYWYKEKIKVSKVKDGDHLSFDTKAGYDHHAIVTKIKGSSGTLVEYTRVGGNKNGQYIVENCYSNIYDRLSDYDFERVVYEQEDSVEQIVNRANYMAEMFRDPEQSENQKLFSYDLFTRNCEHLATWCKTGCWTSAQVTEYVEKGISEVSYFAKCQWMHLGRLIELVISTLADVQWNVHVLGFDAIGGLFFVGIELLLLLFDGYQYWKKLNKAKNKAEKDHLKSEWHKTLKRRVIMGGCSGVGGLIGSLFGPAGTLIGGLLGFAIGEFILHRREIFEWSKTAFSYIKDWLVSGYKNIMLDIENVFGKYNRMLQ